MSSRWYSHLVPTEENKGKCLFLYEIITEKNIIICQQTEKSRRYAVFNNFIDFYHFSKNEEDNCFYEVIRNQPQKPYFDIDLKEEDISLEDACSLMERAILTLHDFCCKITEHDFCISVFSSHGESKISFHIIIDKIYVSGTKQNLCFFKKFMEECDQEVKDIFDPKIYNNNRQFRTLFSRKFGSTRCKMPEFEMYLNRDGTRGWDNDYSSQQFPLFLLRNSLITVVNECEFVYFMEEEKIGRTSFEEGYLEVKDDDISRALELFKEKSGQSAPFTFSKIVSNENMNTIVSLLRKAPSKCPICERIHETENPYLLFWSEQLHVSFDCRRSDGDRYYIGCLNESVAEETSPEPSPVKKTFNLVMNLAGKRLKPHFPIVKRANKKNNCNTCDD